MLSHPRTIQIYLPEGDPRGIRVGELTTSIVRVIELPRALVNKFQGMPEAKQVGLYFLVNDDDDQDKPAVYIGQTGGLGSRLDTHQKNKIFWTRALAVVSLTNNLTQTHVTYLEWLGIKTANDAGRYVVENGNAGTKPHTPAPLEADCLELFNTIRTLIATMGQPVFEPIASAKSGAKLGETSELFYCRPSKSGVEGYDAIGEYTVDGMVVLKGSKARKDMAPSSKGTQLEARRSAMIDDGVLKMEGGSYVFQHDHLFKSPSGAAGIVRAASSNGWFYWVDENGVRLGESKRGVCPELSSEAVDE